MLPVLNVRTNEVFMKYLYITFYHSFPSSNYLRPPFNYRVYVICFYNYSVYLILKLRLKLHELSASLS